jgi:hypothetical protein
MASALAYMQSSAGGNAACASPLSYTSGRPASLLLVESGGVLLLMFAVDRGSRCICGNSGGAGGFTNIASTAAYLSSVGGTALLLASLGTAVVLT